MGVGGSKKEDFEDESGSDVESGPDEVLTVEDEIKRVLRRATPAPNTPPFLFHDFDVSE
jgi:hypothetical protein